MQSVFPDHSRRSDSSTAPASDRSGAAVNRFDRLSRLTSILNPTLRLSRVEFTFGGHVVWVMVMFVFVSIQPMPLNALSDVLALLLLVYAVLQAGRVLHELGHAVVGLLCGRELLRIRLTATVMAVWFPEGDPVWPVRLTCLAGSVVQAMFGAALLLIATTSSPNWLLGLRQSLEIVGAMHIGALTNLLPLPKMDGQYVWGSALRTRPVWLAYAPAVLGPVLAVALICPHLPDPVAPQGTVVGAVEH